VFPPACVLAAALSVELPLRWFEALPPAGAAVGCDTLDRASLDGELSVCVAPTRG
jgi:hypothetical protein